MLRRQKLLIGVLLHAEKIPSHIELMKWAFLLRHETCLSSEASFYDFVPYKYGPFSFTLYREMEYLSHQGYLEQGELRISQTMRGEAEGLFESLPVTYRAAVGRVVNRYGKLNQKELIDFVYDKYPWFASRSEIRTVAVRETKAKPAVFTSGYEGESVDFFFQKLLRAGIRCLIDVRNNPLSRKYGFSKKGLENLCKSLKVRYYPLPQLGIPSSLRMTLNSYSDYQKLLRRYERQILPRAADGLGEATRIMKKSPSVLVCFEKDVRYCHRGCLARAISDKTGMEVIHL